MAAVQGRERLPLAGILLLAAVTFFWGINWPVMKTVLAHISVWWFRAICLWVAGIGLLLIARLGGHTLAVARVDRWPMVILCVFNVVGWHLCSAYGLSLMPAGRAAIIAFTMPVWASVLGLWLLREPLGGHKVLGLVLGVTGLVVLMGGDLSLVERAPVGALVMLGAALTWAMGTVLIKRYRWRTPAPTLVGWHLVLGALPLTAGALAFEPIPDFADLDAATWAMFLFILMGPTLFCQWAFFRIVQLLPATTAAIGTLAIPAIGVYSSALTLGEPVGWQEVVALALICGALASVLILPNLRRRPAA
ncbi:MAG: DMT family transporter [Hyphomicrobiales bacterium]|nr:DMT family transporter [Hyphomicrobiales bacterium]MCP5372224.1 DMT family transporter [Hyphomicrobiales bacterium]